MPRSSAVSLKLSGIAAALEEELAGSKTKLLLCGSTISVMTSLQDERSPMHGRLTPLALRPLAFPEALPFLDTLRPIDRMERFAIAGGMPGTSRCSGPEPSAKPSAATSWTGTARSSARRATRSTRR